MRTPKFLSLLLSASLALTLAACASPKQPEQTLASVSQTTSSTRTIVDGSGREVEIPAQVESIVCIGVGALRYSCYVGAADLVVGVEDYETKPGMSRLYNYVNFDKFQSLPVIGANGEPYTEEIITVSPQVIVMSAYASVDPDELSAQTGTPVVVVPGSDTTLDDKAYETIRILG